MKKVIIALTVVLVSLNIKAQVKIPQASPRCTMEQTVGLTDVAIDYSRPSVKGRVIFGNLVPFGKLWRTGANENTTISFSDVERSTEVPIAKRLFSQIKITGSL